MIRYGHDNSLYNSLFLKVIEKKILDIHFSGFLIIVGLKEEPKVL
jgi:hypothetical protein